MLLLGARVGTRVRGIVSALSCAFLLCAAAAPAHAARPFTTAITDDVWLAGGPAWVQNTVATRARVALLDIDWAANESSAPPPGADPSDPSGPQFNFASIDATVRLFKGSGISPAFVVTDAPSWAEAPGGPARLRVLGAWKPNAAAYGQFAAALARRYSGSYPDPINPGQKLPRVRYYQAWAEANFTVHLAPQWTRSRGRWVATGAALYRNMLNDFYSGVKRVHSDNFVIATGLGPFGDPQPGSCPSLQVGNGCRTAPALFVRELLCLQGQGLRPLPCPNPPHFDAMAVDPYEVGAPTTHALGPDDVSAPDLGKLSRILTRAQQLHRVLPRGRKQLWVTEFGYDSNPPNPYGVSLTTQARWLEEALYIFYTEHVDTAVWYLVRDQASSYNASDYFTGLYYYSGTSKPALEAFRFPFVVWPSGRAATAWGIAPRTGTLAIQTRRGHSWKTLFRLRVTAGGTFAHHVSASLRGNFRAIVSGETSLVWHR
jgi:hypothetical protein